MNHKASIDITGRRFGRLVAIERDKETKSRYRRAIWLCRCDCGNTIRATYPNLSNGHVKSCGCLSHDKRLTVGNRAGNRYGALVVLHPMRKLGLKYSKYLVYWLCHCNCGREVVVSEKALKKRLITSCGCEHGFVAKGVDIGNPKDSCWQEIRQDFIVGPVYGRKISTMKLSDVVGIREENRKYVATLKINGIIVDLGSFTTVDDAVEVRRNVQEKFVQQVLDDWTKIQPKGRDAIVAAEMIRKNAKAWIMNQFIQDAAKGTLFAPSLLQ